MGSSTRQLSVLVDPGLEFLVVVRAGLICDVFERALADLVVERDWDGTRLGVVVLGLLPAEDRMVAARALSLIDSAVDHHLHYVSS